MIRAALDAFAASQRREWLQDRSQTVGASEIGLCARRTYFAKNEGDTSYGHDRDPGHVDGWGARARGSIYEEHWWAPALKARFGDRLLYAGSEQRTLVEGFLSATPDGLLVDCAPDALAGLGVPHQDGDSIGIECKTVDPRARLDGPKPEHVFQVQAQLGLIRDLTPHRPTHAILSYTDASFWDEGREFVVAFDQKVFDEAKTRAFNIMVATKAEYLKPEGVIAGGAECERCPFTRACGQARADRVPRESTPVPTQMVDTLAELARAAKAADDRGDAAQQEAREIREEIRALLAEAGTRRFDHEEIALRWSPVKGRPSWDNKGIREAAAAAGIDIEAFSRAGEPSDRLFITLSETPARADGVAAATAAS